MPVTRVVDIAHVRFSAPDLGAMRKFLEDFGFTCFDQDGVLYARGTDGRPFLHATERGAPAFRGLAFRVESLEELETLARFENAAMEDSTAPGGGKVVRLVDPDGFRVEVVAGQAGASPAPLPCQAPRNCAASQPRFRAPVRLEGGPSHVHRIGHCVLNVSDFRTSEAWYKERFGFLTSDEIEAARDLPLGAFMRCDLGDRPADHHTLFLAQLPQKPAFMHAAFEVANFDDLMLGHAHLKARKHTQAWGVGRHIMGSQVFDYWKDPWGHELEHWTDGDLFTAADPPQTVPVSALLAVQWGAPHPMFAGKRPPPQRLVSIVMALLLRIRRLFRRSSKEQVA